MIESNLLELIRCPLGKSSLKYENNSLICTRCGIIFPIIDGIPSLLIDEAKLPAGVSSVSELNCQKDNIE
jgi:uncharacterized protein